MLSPRLLVAAVALAGCASPGALDAPLDHPARLDAPTASLALAADAPAPVAAPDVPAVLRPAAVPLVAGASGHASHGRASHAGHGAMTAAPPAADPTPLTDALDAYLAVHDALAADRLDPDAARSFAAAFGALAEAPPAGDPHFWHLRMEAVTAVRQQAAALAGATDLEAARAAFGALSVPFAGLVEAAGLPDGYALVRHTCGMAEVAAGGVWLQRPGSVENPFFGSEMPMCGRPDAAPDAHEGHGDHGTHGAARSGASSPR